MEAFELQAMNDRRYIIHPYKFNMWLFILTIIMIFGGLTSAFIVSRSTIDPSDWIIYDLPDILWTNLMVILFSSASMQYAVYAGKRDKNKNALVALWITFALGIAFLIGQFRAWEMLTFSGLPFVDPGRRDNSISYFYVFTGLHGVHIIGGLITLLVFNIRYSLGLGSPTKRHLSLELISIFWHFLGLLWLYLFIFLLVS